MSTSNIIQALAFIPNEDRDIWFKVGSALKTELADAGFTLWINWSRTANNFKEKDARAVWKSIKPGKINIGSLFYLAKQNGYRGCGAEFRGKPIDKPSREEIETQYARQLADETQQRVKAQNRARWIWSQATINTLESHEYLKKKGIQAHGIRVYKTALCLPITSDGRIIESLQFISASGEKRFLGGGAIGGNYFAIGELNNGAPTINLGEGFATMASVFEALASDPNNSEAPSSVVCFSAGNIPAVARKLRAQYPQKQLIIFADPDPAGLRFAHLAAEECGAVVVTPNTNVGV